MPPVSRRQSRFMWAVASGLAKDTGISKRVAKEFVKGHSTKGLPERARKKGR